MTRLTDREYDALLMLQGGGCAVCNKKPTERRFAEDHDHVTGESRGLLCTYCNRYVVGRWRESNARLLQNVIRYLLNPPAQHMFPGRKVPHRKRTRRKR